MTIYAWTIAKPGRQDIKHVSDLAELHEYLRVLDLPGAAPPDWVTMDTGIADHGTYTYNEGSMDEWSLTWTKVDEDTEIID
ncbi:hypothetical protein ASE23_01970 [Rhizobium sp. Root73]|uniref:hypothetical protein n=1 Tax=unclassified Rhizobium TaxID=2613769 RepID=UPI000712C50C|nr:MULTISPECIES: hypothetical protein [unclassified Rhizobium]KQV31163.1 hypothetical protein ASC96_08200 [Rhizobium sp. Root1204]KQY17448.1 hypothetical protein ASD36_01970 [Rhizobium sp. Root1334]KRC13329.1 hypothetical protein ASE23_01970 [Rhizobium sp. Root73]